MAVPTRAAHPGALPRSLNFPPIYAFSHGAYPASKSRQLSHPVRRVRITTCRHTRAHGGHNKRTGVAITSRITGRGLTAAPLGPRAGQTLVETNRAIGLSNGVVLQESSRGRPDRQCSKTRAIAR